MLEKRFYAVPPQAFTADGTTAGVITVAGNAAALFKVGMIVLLNATSQPTIKLQIKEIDNNTNIQVGPISGTLKTPGANTGITARSDISMYTVAFGANIAADEQKRPPIDYAEIMRAVYDEEPSVALRTVLVDETGDRISASNPLSVDADITVNSVGLFTLPYDSIAATYPSSTQEDYQSYIGGLGGTPVQLIVVTYTDATKNFIENVVRTPES